MWESAKYFVRKSLKILYDFGICERSSGEDILYDGGGEDTNEEVADGGEEGNGEGGVNYQSHPSLTKTLDELRRRYDDEEDRRRTLETKIGILLTIDAIVIAYVNTLPKESTLPKSVVLLSIAVSAVICVYTLRPQDYSRPAGSSDDLKAEAFKEEYEFDDHFVWSYSDAISDNNVVNNNRLRNFKWAFYLTVASLAIVFIYQLLTIVPAGATQVEAILKSILQDPSKWQPYMR